MYNQKVTQIGLWSDNEKELETLIGRVASFNQKYMSNVALDLEPHDKGDSQCDRPHVKIRLIFPNAEVQDAFWLE